MKLTKEQKEKIKNTLIRIREVLYNLNRYMENFIIGIGIFVVVLIGLLILCHFLFGCKGGQPIGLENPFVVSH